MKQQGNRNSKNDQFRNVFQCPKGGDKVKRNATIRMRHFAGRRRVSLEPDLKLRLTLSIVITLLEA